jgi:molybdopterin synthase catalytic subunit
LICPTIAAITQSDGGGDASPGDLVISVIDNRIRQVYNGTKRGKIFMIQQWIEEVKAESPRDQLGMILIHNGIVRATSKNGKPIQEMFLTFDEKLLKATVARFKEADGIVEIKVWINQGNLSIGDDIMYVLVAGRFRTDVLPVFQELIREIKNNVVNEKET